jgi:hypothetical protein
MNLLSLCLIVIGAISALIALAIPISKIKGIMRLIGSFTVGAGFCSASYAILKQGLVVQGTLIITFGLLLLWLGLRKYQRDPEGRTPAASIL